MAVYKIGVPRTKQGSGVVPLKKDHPLYPYLVSALDPVSGLDLVTGLEMVRVGTSQIDTGPLGVGILGNNASLRYAPIPNILGPEVSMFLALNSLLKTGAAASTFGGLGCSSGNQSAMLYSPGVNGTRWALRQTNGGGTSERMYNANSSASNVSVVASVSFFDSTASNTRTYFDGVVDGISISNGSAGSNTAFDRFCIGGVARSTNLFADTGNGCAIGLLYSSGLDAGWHESLASNIWQVQDDEVYTFTVADIGGSVDLSGSNSTQENHSIAGAISQAHSLAAANASQGSIASTGSISQTHTLYGENATQTNVGSTGTVGGSINLTGAAASQSNTASTAAITQTHDLTAANSSQANTASSGAISQTHVLAGENASQVNLGSAAALGEVTLTLTGAAGSQSNSGADGAVTQTHVLMAAPSVQDNVASSSAIVQAHVLAASNAMQVNLGSIGAIVIGGVTYWPAPEQVLAGVTYGPTGTEYTGTLTGGAGPTAAEIAAAVIAAAQATPIWADTRRMNGAQVLGDGTEPNKWRGGV